LLLEREMSKYRIIVDKQFQPVPLALVNGNQIQQVLGSDQIRALADRLGVDPSMASNFLAEYLPKIVDKLTPAGKIDPAADHQQGLAALLPSLLQSLSGKPGGDQSAQA